MAKIPYQKPSLDIPDQVRLLEGRGMDIPDRTQAERTLQFVGYYRLSGYWFPFQFRDGTARHSDFRPGTRFDEVLDRYVFDRRLRGLTMDAIERIEVSARASISDVMSNHYGAHWYLDPRHFVPGFHIDFMRSVRREIGLVPLRVDKQQTFIKHYFQIYDTPVEPPAWMVMETLSLGSVSMAFKNLADTERKAIAARFGIPRGRLGSWLHAASHLRNLCAHHSRIWNREFGIVPTVAKSDAHHVLQSKRFYNHAVAIQNLLRITSDETFWPDHLDTLLGEHPGIQASVMGFPTDWQLEPLWSA